MHYTFLLLIFWYVVIFQLIGNLGYLEFSPAEHSVRLTLQQPTRDGITGESYCNPNEDQCEDDFTHPSNLDYCCAQNSSCKPWPAERSNDVPGCKCDYRTWGTFNCTYRDGVDIAVFKEFSTSVNTFVKWYNQTLNTSCYHTFPFAQDRCKRLWVKSEATVAKGAFVADVERYTLLIDHSVNTPDGSKAVASHEMHGALYVGAETRIQHELCANDVAGAVDSPRGRSNPATKAPCYIKPREVNGKDTIKVRTLLHAMGITLDNETFPGSGHSMRFDGIKAKIMIEYSNSIPWTGVVETHYIYKPILIPRSPFKQVVTETLRYPDRRIKRVQHGILFTVLPAGQLATPSFSHLLVQVTTSLTLIAVATGMVNFLARYVLHWRHYYNETFYDCSPDLGCVQALDQMSEEELHNVLREHGLPATGTHITKVLRLLEIGWLPSTTPASSALNLAPHRRSEAVSMLGRDASSASSSKDTRRKFVRSASAPGLAWAASSSGSRTSDLETRTRYPSPSRYSSHDSWKCELQTACFADEYELGKRLAAGHRGTVYLATQTRSRRTVVVKQTSVRDTSDYDYLVGKRHPNILRVFACFNEEAYTSIVMEYCAGGDLFRVLEKKNSDPTGKSSVAPGWAAAVFEQVLSGVEYLHECFGESHNDIKPENILLDREPASMHDVPQAVIADFGCVTLSGSVTAAGGGGGDPRYRAPETFQGTAFGLTTDMWSLGVLLYELLSGGLLIHTRESNVRSWYHFTRHDGGEACNRLMAKLQSGEAVDVDNIQGARARNLLRRLLELDPEHRPTVRAARAHPWFAVRHRGYGSSHSQMGVANSLSSQPGQGGCSSGKIAKAEPRRTWGGA